MINAARVVLAFAAGFCLYTYVGYPALLSLLGVLRRRRPLSDAKTTPLSPWPRVSIVLPVHNEAAVIAATLKAILAIDYPVERRQILVVSDASTDGTDDIVATFADGGVELVRLPERAGKTAAENAARRHVTGEIVVSTDASVRVDARAVKHLVLALSDPSVGVASGRDVSVTNLAERSSAGEAAYVGYEMLVRDLETRVGGIVGASGCLYAIRTFLHMGHVPEALSRDFAAALTAREQGYRAVSVPDAICFVPRSASLRQEYRRKVRTVTRGLATLGAKRALLNPVSYAMFAWQLASHKLFRWLVPWALVAFVAALAVLSITDAWARAALAVGGTCALVAGIGWVWPERVTRPRLVALPAFFVAGNVAVLHAWLRIVARKKAPIWEPTRRGIEPAA